MLAQLRCELLFSGERRGHPADEAPDLLRKLRLPSVQERLDGAAPAVDHDPTRLKKLRLAGTRLATYATALACEAGRTFTQEARFTAQLCAVDAVLETRARLASDRARSSAGPP